MRLNRTELVWLPLVFAALLAIYLPSLGNALVFDDAYLADGELFRDYRSSLEFRARMLSYGSFVWLQALLGADWWKQRVFNLLIHCGVVLVLWALYRQVLRHIEPTPPEPGEATPAPLYQSPALGIAIGIFALNPASVYAVAYLIQRSILMATFFVVLGLWLFMRALGEGKPWLHGLALLSYAAAVMSKEHAILAPLAAVPLYIIAARPRPLRLALVATAGVAIVAATAFVLSLRYGEVLGKTFDEYSNVYLDQLARLNPDAKGNAFALSVINQAYLFFHYGLRWFLPASEWMSINLRPPFPVSFATFPHVLGVVGYATVLVGGFWVVQRYRDWRALAGASVLIPALLFATEFATVWVQDPFVLYRSYLWGIGVPGLAFVALHGPSTRTLAIVGMVLAAGLTWQALDRVWSLSSAETAWTDAIRKLPNDPRSVGRWFPYLNRGSFYAEQNQFRLAMRDFETSAALGDVGMGSFNMGALLAADGKHAKALEAFDVSRKQGYNLYNLPFQRGLTLVALGRTQEAWTELEIARAMAPPSPTRELLLLNLAKTEMQLGKHDQAVKDLQELAKDPKQTEARFLLAMVYVMRNEYTFALDVSTLLIRDAPGPRAHYARALAHYGLKHKAEALADIETALRLGGDNASLREWREKIRGDALMRILHLGKYFPPVTGGMERFLGDLAAAQRRAGDDVSVLVHDGKSAATGDPPWLMRCPVWLKLMFAPISPGYPAWLGRALARFKPQVLHIHMPNPSAFWALMSPAARRIPWVVHWHADVEISKTWTVRLAYPAYRIFERAVLERAECIVVTSRAYLEASKPLAPWAHKCHVVPLGVDPARLPDVRPAETEGLWRTGKLRVLAVGRLTYYKGFETLLRAVVDDPDKELVIVGEGEERPRLQAIIADSRGRPDARLAGEVDDETLHRLIASCDVFCLPSCERTEAFGIVLMEAMRYAKPLLVSELPGSGVNWVARNGQNAVSVPAQDVAAWRAALTSLGNSPAKRQMLGHLGRERYLREFDIDRIAGRIADVYALALRVQADHAARLAPIGVRAEGAAAATAYPPPRGFPDRLLVVIPALNEAEDIGGVIAQVRAIEGIDVVVVDDGSTDETAAVARLSGAAVLSAPLWQGAWGAIQTGIRYAMRHGYSGVVTMDADGQHEPSFLPQLLEASRDADVVIAACPSRGSRMRHVAWTYFRFLTGFELDDLTSGFRYYNARACRLLAMEEATLLDYQDIGVLLLLQHAHLRIREIPVAMNPRKHGASRVFSSWWTVAVYMAETSLLCLARWNQNPKRPAELREIGK